MRYRESANESAELLRLIVPRIAKHGGAYVPSTYALWYEYLSGVNPKLVAALDERLKSETPLTQSEIEMFYARFLTEFKKPAAKGDLGKFQEELKELAAQPEYSVARVEFRMFSSAAYSRSSA